MEKNKMENNTTENNTSENNTMENNTTENNNLEKNKKNANCKFIIICFLILLVVILAIALPIGLLYKEKNKGHVRGPLKVDANSILEDINKKCDSDEPNITLSDNIRHNFTKTDFISTYNDSKAE